MPFEADDLSLLKQVVQDAVTSAQENLAQMVAKQFIEIRTDIQEVQETLRKIGTRQLQIEADLADVGRTSEAIKRRLQDLHADLDPVGRAPQARDFSLRLGHLERELADIRQRLSSVV